MANIVGFGNRHFSSGGVGRNTTLTFASEIVQLAGTLIVLIFLAATLSAEDFGRYSGALALATILGTISRLGTPSMIVRSPGVGTPLALQWRRSSVVLLVGGVLSIPAMTLLREHLLPGVSIIQAIGLVAMQALGFVMAELVVAVGVASRSADVGLHARSAYTLARLLGLAGFILIGPRTLTSAVVWIGASSVLTVPLMQLIVARHVNDKRPFARPTREDLTRGGGFMVNDAAFAFLTSIDRPLLLQNGYVVEAGNYSLGYRLAQVAAMPALAFIRVTDVEFFETGRQRPSRLRHLTLRRSMTGLLLSVPAAVVVYLSSDLISVLAGERFAPVEPVVRWLAALPILLVLQTMPANALSGLDRQRVRNGLLIAIAGVNLALNLLLIPDYGWEGTAAATLLSEALHAVALWTAMLVLTARHTGGQRDHRPRGDQL